MSDGWARASQLNATIETAKTMLLLARRLVPGHRLPRTVFLGIGVATITVPPLSWRNPNRSSSRRNARDSDGEMRRNVTLFLHHDTR